MSSQPPGAFLLDTNVFIEAYRRYYAMDLCPGFWESLVHHCREGRLLSIDRVRAEFSEGDELDDWVEWAPETLFVSTAEEEVALAFSEMMAWVQGNSLFKDMAKSKFAGAADGWLVAYAKVHGLVVVTHEAFRPDAKRSVKIPNVCRQFGVPWEDTFSMLRSLGVTFSLKRA